jgi:acetyl esterase
MYAARLRESGVAAKIVRYDGMIHGFFSMAGILEQGRNALALAAAQLRSAFSKETGSTSPGQSPGDP